MATSFPFEGFIDGKNASWFGYTAGDTLVVRVLTQERWPDEFREMIHEIPHYDDGMLDWVERYDPPAPFLQGPIHLYLFDMPNTTSFTHTDLEQQIASLEGREISLGDLPTLHTVHETEITTKLEKGHLYDLLAIGTNFRGQRCIAGLGRIVVPTNPLRRAQSQLYDLFGSAGYRPGRNIVTVPTFDALKALALENMDISPEEARTIQATVHPMTAWGNGLRRYVCAVLDFEKERRTYSVSMDHMGNVQYHKRDKIA